MSIDTERVRECWVRASQFSAVKERVYPEHSQAQEFERNQGKKVLEYGCGGGSDAMSYLRRDCLVWYVDIVPLNVDMTRRRIESIGLSRKSYGLVIEESDKIPVGSGYFDVISSHGVLHHIEDPVPVLQEFHRLLNKGGLLYVMLYTEHLFEHNKAATQDLLDTKRCETVEEAFGWTTDGEGVPYARHYTEAQGKEFLKAGGFELVSTFEYNNQEFRTFKAVRA
jgi:ubiquinone/menaquinone biosynthesis C-methylase UbiE